jgi:hypothetical protein
LVPQFRRRLSNGIHRASAVPLRLLAGAFTDLAFSRTCRSACSISRTPVFTRPERSKLNARPFVRIRLLYGVTAYRDGSAARRPRATSSGVQPPPGLVPGVQPDLEPAILAPRVDDGRRTA